MSKSLVVLAVAIVVLASGANAWWCNGHMITSQIGQYASPKAASYFANDINYWSSKYANIATMTETACWADDYKKFNRSCNEWHYVNMCFSPDGTKCPTSTGGLLLDILPKCVDVLSDSSSSQNDRSFYLAFLIHLVGDLHQPLHTTTDFSKDFPNGDRGGNEFIVHYNNKKTNLHSYCDSVGELYPTDAQRPFSKNPSAQELIVSAAKDIEQSFTFPPSALVFNGTNFEMWAEESYTTAVNSIYLGGDLKTGSTLTSSYIANTQNLLRKQLALGGRRLGSVFNYLMDKVEERKRGRKL